MRSCVPGSSFSVAAMNLAQLFLVGFDGCSLDDSHWLTAALQQNPPGGVILFDRNVDGSIQNFSSSAGLKELTTQLRELAAAPLLIAVDQEGGKVRRLKERDGFPAFPTAEELGKGGTERCAASASAMAELLAEHGINFNLAPVADLNLNPASPIIARYGRSFSSDPDCAAACCRAFIEAHRRCGVACCLKHFPGHGSAKGDTHLGFVDISEDWQEIELEPYRLLIRDSLADAVMTAHVVHRGLDAEERPASLSPAVTDLLRERLGFGGLIVTDDLQMRAVTDRYGYKEAVRRAVLAGADMLIVGNNLSRRPEALAEGAAAVQELLDQGLIEEERIRTSLARIAALHDKLKGERIW
ncbi:MAG: glycoside hydrolase family 3 protein [Candidatus Electronema sp. V4]|uniref:glycoside hydrolase family 3 protein n=1 Tax=Candidatus Electronema sp. V4 TaxID=3454756 RepID=UPI0040558391